MGFWGDCLVVVIVGGGGFLPCDARTLDGISLYFSRKLELKLTITLATLEKQVRGYALGLNDCVVVCGPDQTFSCPFNGVAQGEVHRVNCINPLIGFNRSVRLLLHANGVGGTSPVAGFTSGSH
jgi:hypothetical protein